MTRMTRTRWPGVDEDKVEAPDGEGTGIDLRDRLRFAAGSLAADFGGELTIDLAEELVFSSAEGLLVAASVTDFVPILAERRARQVVRAGATAHAAVPAPPDGPPRPAQPATAPGSLAPGGGRCAALRRPRERAHPAAGRGRAGPVAGGGVEGAADPPLRRHAADLR